MTLMDHVVHEGLATAFERDHGGGTAPLWGAYPPEVTLWVNELLELPADTRLNEWLFKHPDGRRWIGLKAGTYLADRALKASGKTPAELAAASTDAVLEMAK